MNSLWFCVDPEPQIELRQTQKCQHYFGIFNDHPNAIGKSLKRPSTPFPHIISHENSKEQNFQSQKYELVKKNARIHITIF